MIWPNFSQTPRRMPRRLFSARVARKFLTVSLPPAPACFCSSATMADLSAALSVGAARMVPSLGSRSRIEPSVLSARAAWSRDDDLAAAVYC